MKECMFCNREHNKIYKEGKFKYCEHCKKEMDNATVETIISKREEELKRKSK